jgi:hypothetical protein
MYGMITPILALALLAAQTPANELQVVNEEIFTQLNDHPYYFISSITIKAILPDGSHAVLDCDVKEKSCTEVQSLPPEKLPPKEQSCKENTSKEFGYVHTCTYTNVGTFEFKRSGDKITIIHRNGKTTLRVTSSW